MKTHHNRNASSAVNLGFQIAPMIDVVFVIMLFFMVMAGTVQVENRHNTRLPSDQGPPLDVGEIAIRIEDDGQVLLNDDPLDTPESRSLPELANSLKLLRESSAAANAKVLVTIYADETARYERVVDTLDALTRAEIRDVTFQAGSFE
jgi:biopolymer transport protein ExbD